RRVNGVRPNPNINADFYYQLPAKLQLTAGADYYWGAQVVTSGGTMQASATFNVPVQSVAPDRFSNVCVIVPQNSNIYSFNENQEARIRYMADVIAAKGGGDVYYYDDTGKFLNEAGQEPVPNGKNIVLVYDWTLAAKINDSGFVQASADALAAS